ncbi:MAG: AAA family ATPase [Bdellovibrionota bacterium]
MQQDYLKFWGVDRPVFNQNSEDGSFYFSQSFSSMAEVVLSFAEQPKTLTFVSGAQGMGKSAFAKWVYHQLDYKKHDCIYVKASQFALNPSWLIDQLCQYLGGYQSANLDQYEKLKIISANLDQLIEEKRTLYFIIDSAENLLTQENVKELLTLYHMQGVSGRCLSFLLLARSESMPKVHAIHELNDSISFQCEIKNFTFEETKQYIDFHCQMVGFKRCPFTKEALEVLHRQSGGRPEKINKISESCLIAAAANSSDKITRAIVVKVSGAGQAVSVQDQEYSGEKNTEKLYRGSSMSFPSDFDKQKSSEYADNSGSSNEGNLNSSGDSIKHEIVGKYGIAPQHQELKGSEEDKRNDTIKSNSEDDSDNSMPHDGGNDDVGSLGVNLFVTDGGESRSEDDFSDDSYVGNDAQNVFDIKWHNRLDDEKVGNSGVNPYDRVSDNRRNVDRGLDFEYETYESEPYDEEDEHSLDFPVDELSSVSGEFSGMEKRPRRDVENDSENKAKTINFSSLFRSPLKKKKE